MPIYKVKGGYKIKNTPGISDTKEKAEKRLVAIKISQAEEAKKKKWGGLVK